MPVYISTQPVAEPVEVAVARSHLRVTGSDEDAYIRDLIKTARGVVETLTGRSLVTATWKLVLDVFPACRVIPIPVCPIQAVTGLTYKDAEGDTQTLSAGLYEVDKVSTPGRLILKHGESWPRTWDDGNAVELTFTAGFGDKPEDVPPELKQAILLLVGHWFTNREDVFIGSIGMSGQSIPKGVEYLVMPYRVWQ